MIRFTPRLLLPVVAFAALLAPGGCAKSGPVQFTVSSSQDGSPIEGARIHVTYPLRAAFMPHDFTVVTGGRGEVTRDVQRAPRIDVAIDEPGYRPLNQSILIDDKETWTIRPDPTLIVSAHNRPASFNISRDEATSDVDIAIRLEWESRPTHIVVLPDDFRGLVLLTRIHDVPPLPEPPTPRVFTTVAEPNGTALIPAWPIVDAPYERFRFFTEGGEEIPAEPSIQHTIYASKLREGAETALFIVGDAKDETVLRQALWNFTTTGASSLNVENFTKFVEMVTTSDNPVTGLEIAHALAN